MTTKRQRPTVLELAALLVLIAFTDFAIDHLATGVGLVLLKVVLLVSIVGFGVLVVGLSPAELGADRTRVRSGLAYGLCAGGVVLIVLAILVAIPSSRGHFLSGTVASDSTTQHWLRPLVAIPLGTAVFEETIFRGVLLGAARRRWGDPVAVVFTSIAFGLWHLPVAAGDPALSGAGTPAALVGTFFATAAAGVLFAWLRLRSDSLVAPILAHVATNSGAYAAALVAIRLWG